MGEEEVAVLEADVTTTTIMVVEAGEAEAAIIEPGQWKEDSPKNWKATYLT